MKKHLSPIIFSLVLILATEFQVVSQVVLPDRLNSESFESITDSVIRNEIATFMITGTMNQTEIDSNPPVLNQIPLLSCSDDQISFERGNPANLHVSIIASPFKPDQHEIQYADSLHQWISTIDQLPVWGRDGDMPVQQIEEVKFWFSFHQQFHLPDSAIQGLYEPNFCSGNYSVTAKKEPEPKKIYCSVYESEDKKRVYIYMLNGDGAGGYEVTWIIQEHKYLRRVIDYGF